MVELRSEVLERRIHHDMRFSVDRDRAIFRKVGSEFLIGLRVCNLRYAGLEWEVWVCEEEAVGEVVEVVVGAQGPEEAEEEVYFLPEGNWI